MFKIFQKRRIHEPVALSAVLAASVAINVAWVLNLLFSRMPAFEAYLTLSDAIGPITGMYALVAVVFLLTFGTGVIWFRGKDCSGFRNRVFWFFIASLFAFLVLTHPFVYAFEISGPNG